MFTRENSASAPDTSTTIVKEVEAGKATTPAYINETNSGKILVACAAVLQLLLKRLSIKENTSTCAPPLLQNLSAKYVFVKIDFDIDETETARTFLNRAQDTVRQAYRHLTPHLGTRESSVAVLIAYSGIHNFDQVPEGNYDIILYITQVPLSLNIRVEAKFKTKIVSPFYANVFMESFLALFYQLSPDKKVSEMDVLTDAQKQHCLKLTQGKITLLPDKSLAEYFDESATRFPDKIAVVCDDQSVSYATLQQRSNRLARELVEVHGVQPGDIVAVIAKRSIHTVAAILSILKAGCVYLPINTADPIVRKKTILQDACTKLLLSEVGLHPEMDWFEGKIIAIDHEHSEPSDRYDGSFALRSDTNSLAYIIFTSGSTGTPKGVAISHKGALNMVLDQIEGFQVQPSQRVMQFAALSFDASISEIFMALLSGATLVIFGSEMIADSKVFLHNLACHSINVMTLPPSYLKTIGTGFLKTCRSVQTLITAGEEISPDNARACASLTNYYNAYGPTECSVCVSYYHVKDPQRQYSVVPIGKAIANSAAYVLDEHYRLLPAGVKGEIFVSGHGLAAGYLNNGELTSDRFVALPFLEDARTAYRTGDFGAYDEHGNLIFLGRKDSQVKIRGFRIELFEIEHALGQHPLVDNAIVIEDDGKLYAHLLTGSPTSAEAIRTYLADILPPHMIPHHVFLWQDFPLNNHGKIDRKKLMSHKIKRTTDELRAESPLQLQLQRIWCNVLNKNDISIKDNFFHVGGDSLQAIRLFDELDTQYPSVLQLSDLFVYESIESLAEFMSKKIHIHMA